MSREGDYRDSVVHAERCILGSINLDNEFYAQAAERLKPEDFSLDSHRRIFRTMGKLAALGTPWSWVVLKVELAKTNELDSVGGVSALLALEDGMPRASFRTFEGLVRVVEEASLLMSTQRLFMAAENQAGDGGTDPAAVFETVKRRIAELEARRAKPDTTPMFQDAIAFLGEKEPIVDWLVDKVIPRAGNGIMGGDPKASKSFSAIDLALAASCGAPWMGFSIPRRLKVAVVSREDDAGLTRRRMGKLIGGRREYASFREGDMLINTRRQQSDFQVTNEANMGKLIRELAAFNADLCILDVFRSLHAAEENDNTAIANVLSKVGRIQNELKCSCLIVHHIAKMDSPNPFKGLRGASVIHGWMEFGMAVSVTNPEEPDRADYIRRVQFESKEATTRDVFYRITESSDQATVRLEQLWPEKPRTKTVTTMRDGKHYAAGK